MESGDEEFYQDAELNTQITLRPESYHHPIEMESITPSKLDWSPESISVKPLFKEKLMKRLSYLIILIALTSIASGGVAFKMFPKNTKPLLACLWRAEAMVICLLPLAMAEMVQMRKYLQMPCWSTIGKVALCGFASSMWTATFSVALGFCPITQVYLLNNCQPIIVSIWLKIRGKPITIRQSIGVALGMVGLVLTVMQSPSELIAMSSTSAIGDAIAFSGAIFAAIYLSLGGEIRGKFPGTFCFVIAMWFISMFVYLASTLALEGPEAQSLIDWYIPGIYEIVLYLALVTGILGTSGVVLVMKYLPTIVISVALLGEPIVATLLAMAMNIEGNPSAMTWAGAAVVVIGVLLVSIEPFRVKPAPQSNACK